MLLDRMNSQQSVNIANSQQKTCVSCRLVTVSAIVSCLHLLCFKLLLLLKLSFSYLKYVPDSLATDNGTLGRPLLPYGYSYKASCARPG